MKMGLEKPGLLRADFYVKWLDSLDILDAVRYHGHPLTHFRLIGCEPNRIDRVKRLVTILRRCLSGELYCFGMVFNTAADLDQGAHWVAYYVDCLTSTISFFDSKGSPPKGAIRELPSLFPPSFRLELHTDIEHQTGGSQCGIYVIWWLLHMASGRGRVYKRIPDNMMEKTRDKIFRKV